MRPGHDRGLQSDRGAERPCAVRRRPSCPDRFGGGQMTAIPAFAVYAAAALAEIAGCCGVWASMRPGASALWLLPCIDRKRGVKGKRGSVRVESGGVSSIKKKKYKQKKVKPTQN